MRCPLWGSHWSQVVTMGWVCEELAINLIVRKRAEQPKPELEGNWSLVQLPVLPGTPLSSIISAGWKNSLVMLGEAYPFRLRALQRNTSLSHMDFGNEQNQHILFLNLSLGQPLSVAMAHYQVSMPWCQSSVIRKTLFAYKILKMSLS